MPTSRLSRFSRAESRYVDAIVWKPRRHTPWKIPTWFRQQPPDSPREASTYYRRLSQHNAMCAMRIGLLGDYITVEAFAYFADYWAERAAEYRARLAGTPPTAGGIRLSSGRFRSIAGPS